MISKHHFEEFVRQARRVGSAGLTICSSGNLSWRIGEEVLVSGTGSWVPELTADRVARLNLATGEMLNGVKPSMESVFHLGVLRERPDCDVVLHFQSPFATAIACSDEIPDNFNVTAEVPCHVGREIPIIPYNSALMLKHGQVVCGKDFDEVFERAMFFEMACRIIKQNGGRHNVLTDAESDDLETYVLGKKQP